MIVYRLFAFKRKKKYYENIMRKKKKSVYVPNARRGKYREAIEQIEKDGVCPFCPKHLRSYHKKRILKTGKRWLVTKNMYPYENAKFHFLLIYKKHIESLNNISKDAWTELLQHYTWILKKYKIPGGTVFLRFGNPQCTGSSVTHLHAQLVSARRGKAVVTRI